MKRFTKENRIFIKILTSDERYSARQSLKELLLANVNSRFESDRFRHQYIRQRYRDSIRCRFEIEIKFVTRKVIRHETKS